jgi:hypothetical protein
MANSPLRRRRSGGGSCGETISYEQAVHMERSNLQI